MLNDEKIRLERTDFFKGTQAIFLIKKSGGQEKDGTSVHVAIFHSPEMGYPEKFLSTLFSV